jgi:PAS domain S-box-containing protein
MKYNIGFIAPYRELADLFAEVGLEFNKKITIKIGDLEEGVKQAKELEKQGVEVIISRGGTAIAIEKEIADIPVVKIQISGFDIIRAIHQIKKETNKIAIIGFHPFTYGIEGLGRILDIEIRALTLEEGWYDDTSYIKQRVEELKKENFNWIIGDNISVEVARELGMNGILIESGKEALIQSILEAERVAKIKRIELEKTKRFKSIIDFAYEGIITIDQNGIIDNFNPQAEKVFGKSAYQVVGESINKIFPEREGTEILKVDQKIEGKIFNIGETSIVANIIPIEINKEIVRHIITFQEASEIQKVEQRIRRGLYLKGNIAENHFEDIIGQSPVIENLKEEAKKFAEVDSPVLIYGETGTGKELFAQSIHNYSKRKKQPFVALNCAALPDNILESELFGYVEGAFTGARKGGKMGLFEQAHGGTIFLDEIGEISKNTQVSLLRVLQEQKIRRLGDDRVIPIDVRVITSTNKNLTKLVKEGKFREDLFYRINVLNIILPNLNQRKSDIPLLVDFFIKKYKYKFEKEIKGISEESISLLQDYDWPGNIRQLENVIERLVISVDREYIQADLVRKILDSLKMDSEKIYRRYDRKIIYDNTEENLITISLDNNLKEMERMIIHRMLEEEKGNKTLVAKKLGIGRSTLWRKLNNTEIK